MVGIRSLRQFSSRSRDRALLQITISGATRSGKSTLTKNLKKKLRETNRKVISIHLDNYRAYTLGGIRVVDELGRRNWETSNNINFEALLLDLKKAKENADVVLMEGFCVLENKTIRETSHIVFHLDISKDQCRERRRRSKNSHPSKDWTFDQYFDEVIWPVHLEYKSRLHGSWKNDLYSLNIIDSCTIEHAEKIAVQKIEEYLHCN